MNDTRRTISTDVPSRRDAGLPDDGFVFCSFNSNYKITAQIFDIWMHLLHEISDSVLWLLESNRQAPSNLRREAQLHGIDSCRLIFAPRRPLPDHLARHRLADLFLDTFPMNAHIAASDALWAGLPVLTLAGDAFVSRVAGSLLRTLKLPELITANLNEYQARALQLARHPQALAELQLRLRNNRLTSSVFDIRRSARAIEQAYATMQEIRLRGEVPRAFAIP